MDLPVDRHLKLKGENKFKIIIIIIVALLTAPLRTDRPSGASKGISVVVFRKLAMDQVALGRVYLAALRLSLSLAFHQCSTLIFNYVMVFPEGQTVQMHVLSRKGQCFTE